MHNIIIIKSLWKKTDGKIFLQPRKELYNIQFDEYNIACTRHCFTVAEPSVITILWGN